MQSEVPALPVVRSDGNKRFARDTDLNDDNSTVQLKNHNTCKISSNLVSNRKQLHPLVGGPYRNSMRLYALSEPVRSTNKTTIGQRVMSAKMLRVKQLQNQLTDAHYHLNELTNENRLLKALQKRQDSALRKYEGTNAELPRIINSHHEELKVLQLKHKKLRAQHKSTCDLLKEKENEIHSLQSQNKHLVQLSKDRNLEERDKLQIRVSDLNFRIQQQQDTIQTLNRKLALESKSLKHQLNAEVAKHKETQKHLHETLEKLKNLEDLLDNREKRLYYSGRLPVCNKGKAMGSQSLMNLGQNGVSSNPLKSGGKSRELQNDPENGSLPKLTRTESSDGKTVSNMKNEQTEETSITETMSSLQQLRKFRLQKSYSRNGSAGLTSATNKSEEDENTERNDINAAAKYSRIEKLRAKRTTTNENELDNDDDDDDEEMKKFVDNFEITGGKESYKLPKQLMREFGYSSSDSESETENIGENEKFQSVAMASKSRDLHNRLIADQTSLDRHSVPNKVAKKKTPASTSASESESENPIKTLPTLTNDCGLAVPCRSRNDQDNVGPSLDDFLKFDVNATDSDSELERIDTKNFESLEKTSNTATDGPLADGYETSQQRLMTMTKSWTEVQAKIQRDREISENQLKSLNEEGTLSDNFLSDERLSSTEIRDNLTRDRRLSVSGGENDENFEESHAKISAQAFRSHRRNNNLAGELPIQGNIEIPQARQNGAIKGSQIGENVSTIRTENTDCHGTLTESSEFETITRNIEDLSIATINSRELTKKITENGIVSEKDDSTSVKLINYNKQKLLAAMRAIDDNENMDFLSNQKYRAPAVSASVRSQTSVTENLYRGLPSHARKKNDIMKEMFGDGKIETKLRAGCSKLTLK